jgi:glycosyltransferase involved in cell wall biosynthesis
MRVLSSLTYFTPHISGLTIYARRILQGLVERGHAATVVTSQHERALPKREVIDGVTVVRTRATIKVSKGILMPFYPFRIARELHRHDLLLLHLPQIESSIAALYARFIARKPIVTTFHCDIELPRGLVSFVFTPAIKLSHLITGYCSNVIVINSRVYGEQSRYVRRFRHKVLISPPPCALAAPGEIERPSGSPLIGFVGRFAREKGVDDILESIPAILAEAPDARVVFVGETRQVVGEHVFERIEHRLDELRELVTLTGVVPDAALAAYMRAFDVLVLPSTNSTESFGMVQVESMLAGTPVVATDRPGVREPVRATGMGELVPQKDPQAIARAVLRIWRDRASYVKPAAEIELIFGVRRAVDFYESLFDSLLAGRPLATFEDARLTHAVTTK